MPVELNKFHTYEKGDELVCVSKIGTSTNHVVGETYMFHGSGVEGMVMGHEGIHRRSLLPITYFSRVKFTLKSSITDEDIFTLKLGGRI